MIKLDETNQAILRILQKDSSLTNQQLAAQIGLSPAATLERVKRMEQTGIIRQYAALLDPKKLEMRIKAFILVTMKDHTEQGIQAFSDRVREFPEVMECCRLAGERDYILKVVSDNMDTFEEFTRTKLSTLPGIDKTSSSIVLASIVDRTDLPL